jgi:hypothetical protein
MRGERERQRERLRCQLGALSSAGLKPVTRLEKRTCVDQINITTYPTRLSSIVLILNRSIPSSAYPHVSLVLIPTVYLTSYLLPLDASEEFPLAPPIAEYPAISAVQV